ncbi:MAG TPA: Cache 3/Cache 2 fusion domain-containing protein, partial [Terrimicrobiaceae bacterium]|nr:Cache 3/Cache 2 fusion domain-containing protein [Terrimicrobiaceae bacterium]
MQTSLRKKVALWFLFVAVAVVAAGYAGFRRLSDYIFAEARTQMDSKLAHVDAVLAATNTTYLSLVQSSMAVLRMLSQEQGDPRLKSITRPDGSSEKVLFFGDTPATKDEALVDKVKAMMGGTASIFVKRDDAFVRISTNVLKPDGTRAVGTILEPDGLA